MAFETEDDAAKAEREYPVADDASTRLAWVISYAIEACINEEGTSAAIDALTAIANGKPIPQSVAFYATDGEQDHELEHLIAHLISRRAEFENGFPTSPPTVAAVL